VDRKKPDALTGTLPEGTNTAKVDFAELMAGLVRTRRSQRWDGLLQSLDRFQPQVPGGCAKGAFSKVVTVPRPFKSARLAIAARPTPTSLLPIMARSSDNQGSVALTRPSDST